MSSNLVQPVSKHNFTISFELSSLHVRPILRSQNKEQVAESRCQGSQYPKGSLSLIPKPLTFFKALLQPRPSSDSAPNGPTYICTTPHFSLVGEEGT